MNTEMINMILDSGNQESINRLLDHMIVRDWIGFAAAGLLMLMIIAAIVALITSAWRTTHDES